MSKNYKDYSYFTNRPDVVKIFEDLEAYLDYCRIELCDFNPADLYRKDSKNYQNYLYSKRPKRPWVDRNNGERKPYQGNKPRYNNDRFSR